MLIDLRPWLVYFEQNAVKPPSIPWHLQVALTPEERQCIAPSIAAFQLGEYSEGKGLMQAAQYFSQQHDLPELPPITRLFIKEEQHHALLLKQFMDRHQMPLLKNNWTDGLFRKLRKNVSYPISITVLVSAEIIALVYYQALRNSTQSLTLRAICEKILQDERAHVAYEASILKALGRQTAFPKRVLIQALHRLLFLGMALVVYKEHRRLLQRGGYAFPLFWAAGWTAFDTWFTDQGELERAIPISHTQQ
ncbi:hypothetical protein [Synechocystis sp. LKSZ1]|uniref:hypothetical protein n=1 Tax=Synechocystis sp. LKSZ1 TaxID=3144951 RepID=UPI00336BB333